MSGDAAASGSREEELVAQEKFIDSAMPLRAGEELATKALEGFLQERLAGAAGTLSIEQFPSGHSNLTYLLRMGEDEWVLRRPPFGAQARGGHDMSREFRVLSGLYNVYSLVPKPLLFSDDEDVLDAPFYVMERLRGVILRATPPPELDLSPAVVRRLSENFVDNLARIHTLDYEAAGLRDLGKPQGYVRRQITGWIDRYAVAKTDEIPEMERVAAWLAERVPTERATGIIHNDYKYDNLVLDPNDLTRIVGVLDWEMATLGDPVMDLASALSYWIEARDSPALVAGSMGPTHLPGSLTRREIIALYSDKTGIDVSGFEYYYVYALFKLAVVLQQIYTRFAKGFTQDERFRSLGERVVVFAGIAERVIEDPAVF